jgi:hypothetical protein
MMPKGGRTPGSVAVKTGEVALRLKNDGGIQPLEIMYLAMRSFWERSKLPQVPQDIKDEFMSKAVVVAERAAPYVSAKLATTTVKGDADNPLVVQQETTIVDERKPLDAFIAEWVRPAIESSASEH